VKPRPGKYSTAIGRWAGFGPYYAMFPVSFAHDVINRYSQEGDTVLDVFAGRGTSLYSAAALNRRGLGVEVNPVGWIYTRTKLSPVDKTRVEKRLEEIQSIAPRYSSSSAKLPLFFHHCFSCEVRRFLVCARAQLDWRRSKVDRTLMAFILVHLHGKRSDSLSNQMRQTKAMAPKYAIRWWKQRRLKPPLLDPVDFLRAKLRWRYAKGVPEITPSNVHLGDSVSILPVLRRKISTGRMRRPSLLLTSPPYFGITNYHYDQWLRLWLLGGVPSDRRSSNPEAVRIRGKFENRRLYRQLLGTVFERASKLLKRDAVVYVRTDCREPTLSITKEALKAAFPTHRLHRVARPIEGNTQTRLFGNGDPRVGEVDLVLTVPMGRRTSRTELS
jgi:DNA methylase